MHKIGQSGAFLGRLLEPLLKSGLLLIKNVLKQIDKSILIPLRLKTAASVRDAAIQKKIFGSGMTMLIISNEGIDDIMKIAHSLQESALLIKGASLFGNMLTGK